MPHYAVIIALFNEEENVPVLYQRLDKMFQDIDGTVEYWFIDDGSADKTADIIQDLSQTHSDINLIKFSRNFGHHIALFAGLEHAGDADFYIMMDGDLQDQPEEIPKLIAKQKDGYELVYAKRKTKSATSKLFWILINLLSDQHIPHNQSVFRLFTRKVRDALNQIEERHKFLAGIFSWVGFSWTMVDVDDAPRHSGASKYGLVKQMQQALNAVTGFSVLPLRYITYSGLLISTASFMAGVVLLVQRLISEPPAGWTFLMVTIFFALGIQMISLGVIAEYIGKSFQQAQKRPNYIIDKFVSGKGGASHVQEHIELKKRVTG